MYYFPFINPYLLLPHGVSARLHVFGSGFQDYLLHHLPRDQSEVDLPVVPQIFLLSLLEGRIAFI